MGHPQNSFFISCNFDALSIESILCRVETAFQFFVPAFPGLQVFDLVFDDCVQSINLVSCFIQQSLVPIALLDVLSYFELISLLSILQFINLTSPISDLLLALLNSPTFCVVLLLVTLLNCLQSQSILLLESIQFEVLLL